MSGLTGKAPDNPNLSIWLNAKADLLPDGTRDVLRIRNATLDQPEIVIPLIFKRPALPPPLPFRLVKLNGLGVELSENPLVMQADVVIGDTGTVTLVNQGFPPIVRDENWGRRAVIGNAPLSWETAGLPSWLDGPSGGKLVPMPFENRIVFTLRPEHASDLAPGQTHKAIFYIEQSYDTSKRLGIEAELFVHRPPSHFFQLTPGRGPAFSGVVGGPFTGLQTSIEVAKQGGEVKWEVANLPAWLTLSQTSGDAPATVQMSINQQGNDLQPGQYATYLVFRNLTGYQTPATKIVTLNVRRH